MRPVHMLGLAFLLVACAAAIAEHTVRVLLGCAYVEVAGNEW